ncbi:MAG: polysaccharide pyruvyl transferase family protein [Rikenellaceae bacterium]
MKIAIQTLPLNSNYGGILQAYALQSTLQRMGHEVSVIARSCLPPPPPLSELLIDGARRALRRYIFCDQEVMLTQRRQWIRDNRIINQHTRHFVERYICELPCDDYSSLPPNSVDAIVVGSDQVWRPRYFGEGLIADAYLAFARGWSIRRVAYAASFGSDEWEYTEAQREVCRELLAQFDYVSVREVSGVRLCREYLGVDASQLLDPTMLLSRGDYEQIVERGATTPSPGNLMLYILDPTPDKERVAEAIAKGQSLTPFSVRFVGGVRVEDMVQPPLEQWIRGFADAEFVVTDSFHATVFAILFNTPFVVCANRARGATRLHSLLGEFGLEGRFVESEEELERATQCGIDWARVNCRVETLRGRSVAALRGCFE